MPYLNKSDYFLKRIVLTAFILCILSQSNSAFSFIKFFGEKVKGIVRINGNIGASGSSHISISDDQAYSIGSQLLFAKGNTLFYTAWGVDLAYSHYFIGSKNNNTINGNYFRTLVMGEASLFLIQFQMGLGPYFSIENNLNHDFALFASAGFSLPINKNVFIPITARFDYLFINDILTSQFQTGLSYYYN